MRPMSYAQLPLQSDPPDTTAYRGVVEQPFNEAAAMVEPTVTLMPT
jgi:hypothetical protein